MRTTRSGPFALIARFRPSAALRVALGLLVVLPAGLGGIPAARAADDSRGEQIYRQTCARCHGAAGEGTAETQNHPLIGDKSIGQLTKLIAKTMPEDDVGSCVGDDAADVATYIHETFYSPTARVRHAQARLELARLTVKQYRNVVADLIGGFRSPPPSPLAPRIGLHGEYYKSRQHKGEDRVIDRTDPVVRFDFGEGSPLAGTIPTEEFSVSWQGSVFAPETGEYQFVIRSRNGARLWVNDARQPLIDAWVRSGTEPETRASVFLLGGRSYPLRLEFFKSKEAKEKSAAIALLWKPPGGVDEVVPERVLSPERGGATFVVGTPFPPDDRSVGYERGASISRAWDTATTDAALEVAAFVTGHLDELAGAPADASDRLERIKTFCSHLAERAFRRPLSEAETNFFITRQFEKPGDAAAAVKRVVILVLKSARFLYVDTESGGNNPCAVAERLALGLWDSLPDEPLRQAAETGGLATRDDVARQAERMLADPRARAKLRDFFLHWLKAEGSPELSKDPQRFPEFTPELAADLRTSLDLFLDDVAWSDSADLRQLFLADTLYVNGRLAKFYGIDLPDSAPFQKVQAPAGTRAGVLTHPYLLALLAYSGTSSPIHRGVFLYRGVLGRSLRPPPAAVAPLAPELHAQLTTRERVSLQTSPETCQTCHALVNPLGFSLESYDAAGRFRTTENDRTIDSSGAYLDRTGSRQEFAGASALAIYLASSEEAHAAFIEQLLHHLVKQPAAAFGPNLLPALRSDLVEQNFHIRKLMVDIMARTALREAPAGSATLTPASAVPAPESASTVSATPSP